MMNDIRKVLGNHFVRTRIDSEGAVHIISRDDAGTSLCGRDLNACGFVAKFKRDELCERCARIDVKERSYRLGGDLAVHIIAAQNAWGEPVAYCGAEPKGVSLRALDGPKLYELSELYVLCAECGLKQADVQTPAAAWNNHLQNHLRTARERLQSAIRKVETAEDLASKLETSGRIPWAQQVRDDALKQFCVDLAQVVLKVDTHAPACGGREPCGVDHDFDTGDSAREGGAK
jgi:5-methylcytosine-specific restriction endonuclease McrA